METSGFDIGYSLRLSTTNLLKRNIFYFQTIDIVKIIENAVKINV